MVDIKNAVIINNTNIVNSEINNNNDFTFGADVQRKDVFDKNTLLPEYAIRDRLNNADEFVEYNGKNLWLNFWYMMQDQPWQITVKPEKLSEHYWFDQKLLTFASDLQICNLVLFTKKDIVDTVCEKVPAGDETRIREVLDFQIKFRERIKKYHFNEIVYTDDSDVDSELKQKVLNIYNEIQ